MKRLLTGLEKMLTLPLLWGKFDPASESKTATPRFIWAYNRNIRRSFINLFENISPMKRQNFFVLRICQIEISGITGQLVYKHSLWPKCCVRKKKKIAFPYIF
jgi:hypothetical protein